MVSRGTLAHLSVLGRVSAMTVVKNVKRVILNGKNEWKTSQSTTFYMLKTRTVVVAVVVVEEAYFLQKRTS